MEFFRILAPDGTIVNPQAFFELELSSSDLIRIYENMVLTRIFTEQAKRETRREEGIPLYISDRGQEAVGAASAYALGQEGIVFWYSRFQSAPFAKGVLPETMFKLFRGIPDKTIAEDMLNRSCLPPYVLVGSHLTNATGYAWACKMRGKKSVVAVYFGDGATAQGDFHSAMNFASILRLPVVFICVNNQWAIATPTWLQTATQTFAEKASAYNMRHRRVDGNDFLAVYSVTKEAAELALEESVSTLIEAVTYRIDSHTTAVFAIRKAPPGERQRACLEDPLGSILNEHGELASYEDLRSMGIEYSPGRTKKCLMSRLTKEKFGLDWTERDDLELWDLCSKRVKKAAKSVSEIKPASFDGKAVILESALMHRVPKVAANFRDISPDLFEQRVFRGTPEMIRNSTFREALQFAILDAMRFDNRVMVLGEDVGDIGSVFRTAALPGWFVEKYMPEYRDKIISGFLPLQEIFGGRVTSREELRSKMRELRVYDTPLDEEGIVGNAIGLALGGMRPIVEIQFSGFVFEAFNQIVSELAQISHIAGGAINLPAVIRLPYGGGRYIQHHREFEAPYFMNSPGLRIVIPSTVQDAYDMFVAAVASENPVLFFEDKNLYRRDDIKADLIRGPFQKPIEEFGMRIVKEADLGAARRVTITAYGRLVYKAFEAAKILEQKGISAEVLDIRVFKPLDEETLIASFEKTEHLVVVQEEPESGSTCAELVRRIMKSSRGVNHIAAPYEHVGPPDAYNPPPLVWEAYEPQVEEIVEAAERTFSTR